MGRKNIVILICSILIIALNAQLFSAYAFGETGTDNRVFTQSDREEYSRAEQFLNTLGVLTNYKNIDATVTRGEYAAMLVKLLGIDLNANSYANKKKFSDYAKSYGNNAALNIVSDYGIMTFYDKGNFSPESDLTYDEAIEAMVKVLGYGVIANGGSAAEYIGIAAKIGLNKDLSGEQGYPILRSELVKLIMSALEINIMTEKLDGSGNYYVDNDATLLSSVFHLSKHEGIVTANEYTQYSKSASVAKGKVAIDGIAYNYDGQYTDLIGYNVEYYLSNNERDVIFIAECDNDVLEINGEDIVDYSDRVYTYYNSKGKETVEKVPYDCVVIYNGKVLTNSYDKPVYMYTDDSLVKFVDNNSDGKWDVLFIYNYNVCITQFADTDSKVIYDKFDNSKIDYSQCDDVVFVNSNGKIIEDKSIKAGNVLTYCFSADGQLCVVYVSNKSEMSEVTSCTTDNGIIDTVSLANGEYETVNENESFADIAPGVYGKFYLDYKGRIAYFEKESTEKVGYLIDAFMSESYKKRLEIRILNSDGAIEVIGCCDKITFNDSKKMASEDVYDKLCDGGTEAVSQMILYGVDSNGMVKTIYTLAYNDKLRLVSTMADNSVKYRSSAKCFTDGKTFLNDSCKIFYIPDDCKNADSYNFAVRDITGFKNDYSYSNTSRVASFYQIGDTKLGIDVCTVNGQYYISGGNVGLITDMKRVLDSKGDECTRVTVAHSSGSYQYYVYDGTSLNNAATGDVVSIGYLYENSNRRMTSISVLYDIGTGEYTQKNPTSLKFTDTSRYFFGGVHQKDKAMLSMVLEGGTLNGTVFTTMGENVDISADNYCLTNVSGASIYKYDKSARDNKVIKCSADDIASYADTGGVYNKVFILTSSEKAVLCYIAE